MGVSCVDGRHAALHEEPPAWVLYVAAQAEPRALVAEPDVPAVAQAGLRALAAGPDAPVVERAGLREPDALVVAQGGPPAAWAGLWFRVGVLYGWAAAVPPVLTAWAGLWFRAGVLYGWAVAVPPVLTT